uniref:WD repeat-containing protein 25 n=1 Tax=Noccaea caerulescens TaxID=107243 RepID=A0A1J3D0H0_NOCCA
MSCFAVHLLASAGLDGAVYVWNVWSSGKKKARAFLHHNAPVKDVKWSKQGLSLLSCGYDCTARLFDVERGVATQTFKEDQGIGVAKFHPDDSNLFLSGGFKGSLRLWDIRNNKVAHEYIRESLGPILDVEFISGGKRFVSSSDVSGSNISENAVVVWDLSREVPLSKQVYAEAYTCPCIKRHPQDQFFIAQSHGNYTAIFSTNPPFKLNKYKRYEGHWVAGFPIKCNFSPDGEILVSGSSDGSIYMYAYKSSALVKRLKAYEHPCVDVAYHPVLPNVVASCSWNGQVSVFE